MKAIRGAGFFPEARDAGRPAGIAKTKTVDFQ